MKVNFYATLRQIVGRKTKELHLPEGTTVRQLIETVLFEHPALRPMLFDEMGELHGHVHVFINGRDAPYLHGGLEARLALDDTVDIFPATGGG